MKQHPRVRRWLKAVATLATGAMLGSVLVTAVAGPSSAVDPDTENAVFVFEVSGWQAESQNFKNSIWLNGEEIAQPRLDVIAYADLEVAIPLDSLSVGENTVRVRSGSTTASVDEVNNNDDFSLRNARLRFAGGLELTDPTYGPGQVLSIGDGPPGNKLPNPVYYQEFTVDVPASALGEEPADPGVWMSLSDDDTVTGTVTVRAGADGPVLISVDDQPLDVTSAEPEDPMFVFGAAGWQADQGYKNSVWLNGVEIAQPTAMTSAGTIEVPIPLASLLAGDNKLRIRSGSTTSSVDEVNNNDDFTVSDPRLVFESGLELRDPATPAGNLNIGDGPPGTPNPNPTYFREFTIAVPEETFDDQTVADWETIEYADGEHVVTATVDGSGESVEATVHVDNTGPVITSATPATGESYKSVTFDVTAVDARSDVDTVELTVDGRPVENGATLSGDELGNGDHTMHVVATDVLGNVSELDVDFTAVGNYPIVDDGTTPADETTGLSTTTTDLGVTVSDPTGDELDVVFKWAETADFSDPAGVRVTRGTTVDGAPGLGDGTELDSPGRAAIATGDGATAASSTDEAYPFQQFEIEVPTTYAAQSFEANWQGEVSEGQRAELSVWNYDTQSWKVIADGEGAGEPLELSGEATYRTSVRKGKARLLVQNAPEQVLTDGEAVFAWMTDTQYYSEREPATYQKMVDWVVDNAVREDIAYTVHTGDIINTATGSVQWADASNIMETMDDADLAYGVVPGNHDIQSNGSYSVYSSYFGADRYEDRPWYGGSVDDNVQHYDLVSTPKADYMIVYVEYRPDDSEIAWVNEVIAAHPNHNVIVATHEYIGLSGAYQGAGQAIFDQIVLPNKNVDLVLSGHVHGVMYNVKHDGDRVILEVLSDYQDVPTAGGGWMRTLEFDSEADTFTNNTFTVLGDQKFYFSDALENFTEPIDIGSVTREVATDYVSVDVESNQVIGEQSDIASGTSVSVPAGQLEPNTQYAWFAEASDDEGYLTRSPVWSFTTGAADGELEPTMLSAPPVTGTFGKSARLAVSGLDASATGTVRFASGGTTLCQATVASGAATCAISAWLGAGTRQVTAAYSGDDAFAAAQKAFTLRIAKAKPFLNAKAHVRSVPKGKPATFAATLPSRATGKVTFRADGRTLCVGQVRDGRATCKTSPSLKHGVWKVTATYSGNGNYTAAKDAFSFRKQR